MSTLLSSSEELASPPGIVPDEGSALAALTLQGIGPAKKLSLDFAERINLLTGDNGLGKTFILDCAWWALSGQWAGFSVYPRSDTQRGEAVIAFELLNLAGKHSKVESLYNWEKQAWPLPAARSMVPGLLLYARVDGAFAVWDPAKDYWSSAAKPPDVRPLIFSREEIWNGIRHHADGRTAFLANGLIQDWVTWQNAPDQQSFTILKNVLERLSPPSLEMGDLGRLEPGKPIRIAGDSRLIPTIKHSYGEVPVVYASAGVRRIVALAYLIVWAWQEHQEQSALIRKEPQKQMVVLIDEIEAHLHPQWQRTILPALLQVQHELDPEIQIQLLVATHSPLVLASIEPFFAADKDKIFHIELVRHTHSGAEVEIQNVEFVRYGTVDSWLRSEVFELGQARSVEAEKAIEDAKKLQAQEHVPTEEVREVSERLMKYLPTHGDGFWPRWTFFARQHGVDL
ncbi:MAG: ATP-binding protein [Caldilineaceae bacterium]